MVEPLALWHGEHFNFAQLLELLDTQIAAFHRGEHPNYDLMIDIVTYMHNYADRIHHPREDVAFARLARHEPRMAPVIDRLTQEHRVIATAGAQLLQRLQEATGDVMAPRAALEAAASTYLVYYRSHLDTEEREILPRAAQMLTQADWAAVRATVPAIADPLFGDDVDAGFRVLRSQIEREATLPLDG